MRLLLLHGKQSSPLNINVGSGQTNGGVLCRLPGLKHRQKRFVPIEVSIQDP